MDIERSIIFIDEKGSALEKARLHHIIHGLSPQPEVIVQLASLQNTDGGFPFGMVKGNLSVINETTVVLWWLEELDLLTSLIASRAFDYLLAIQKPDGGWDEDPRASQYELQPWIQPGDLNTRMYLTAITTYWLAVAGYKRHQSFRKAVHFLLRHQDHSGKFYGYLLTTWIATSVLLLAGERYMTIASLGIQTLSAGGLEEWADSQIAWALDCFSRAGLPVYHPFVAACLAALPARQRADGSWGSADGEAFAVSTTIQLLKVLKRYGLISPN